MVLEWDITPMDTMMATFSFVIDVLFRGGFFLKDISLLGCEAEKLPVINRKVCLLV